MRVPVENTLPLQCEWCEVGVNEDEGIGWGLYRVTVHELDDCSICSFLASGLNCHHILTKSFQAIRRVYLIRNEKSIDPYVR